MTDETPDSGTGGVMPFQAYADIEAVNWSKLKRMLRSPRHYKFALDTALDDDSDPIRVGRATHTAVFEPHRFDVDVVEWTGGRRAGKTWDEFCAMVEGKTILTSEQYARVARIRDAVRLHPLVAPLLEHGQAEQVLEWTDPHTQLRLKCRIDWLSDLVVLDLKTSRNAIEPRKFASDAYGLGYFHQLAFYQRGVEAIYGTAPPAVIVAVETEGPHDLAVYRLPSLTMHSVNAEIDELLTLLKLCMGSGKWPGRFETERELTVPAWAMAAAMDEDVDDPDWMKEAG